MQSSLLHVIAAFSNHNRYQVRKALLREWLDKILASGARITIVQHTLGERAHELDPDTLPALRHAQLVNLRGGPEQEVWLQHALYNAGIARLPEDARYVCWQDADITHLRDDWAVETLHMLQHYRVGQTWTHVIDLDPQGNIATNEWNNDVDRSFAAAWQLGDVTAAGGDYSRALLAVDKARDFRAHTGYSWSIRRDALAGIGRLLDWMIIGSGDYHMAHGFAGTLRSVVAHSRRSKTPYQPAYYRRLLEFADRCDRHIRQDIGVVPGTISHHWHGSKRLRLYGAREQVMRESRFDPDTDITSDVNGLPTLCTDNRLLRDGLRRYNRARNEDSIDVY